MIVDNHTGFDMKPKGILVYYHCNTNTGYAIGRHEIDFYKMACLLTGDASKVHLGYTSTASGMPSYIAKNYYDNVIEFDSMSVDKNELNKVLNYIKSNNIDVAFGFDQPVKCPAYSVMRKAGIKLLVSYWGAPMSSIFNKAKLLLKKIDVMLAYNKPDHFIFQSNAMADSAIYGRGISQKHVSVIHNAVDTNLFKPDTNFAYYAHQTLNIPRDRKIVYYSGHMEERKGVHIIIEAANELVRNKNRKDVHFIFLGNIDGQEKRFAPMYVGSETENFITFCGYRNDINQLLSSSYMGVIASTGWDSFTMSSMEIASSGLPLIVSNLQGLTETVIDGVTGYVFPAGDSISLANKVEALLDDPDLQVKMGSAGRQRVIERFSLENHINNLVSTMQHLYNQHG